MKNQEIKFKNSNYNYSILIGENVLRLLPKKINKLCPKTKKIAIIIDSNVPKKFKKIFYDKLKKYDLLFLSFSASEKNKSFSKINYLVNILLSKNFRRRSLWVRKS